MNQYLLLLHEDPSAQTQSPAEMQSVLAEYSAWAGKMAAEGRLVDGQKLTDDGGRIVTSATAVDGPYAEAKEVLAGLFVVNAETYEEAVGLARDCPHLRYGTRVEVREIQLTSGEE